MILRRDHAAAMPFIMLATLIDMIAIGLIIPVLPALVGSFTASQTEQAIWYGVVTFAFGAANFVSSPLLGALSVSSHREASLAGLAVAGVPPAPTAVLLQADAVRVVPLGLVRLVVPALALLAREGDCDPDVSTGHEALRGRRLKSTGRKKTPHRCEVERSG